MNLLFPPSDGPVLTVSELTATLQEVLEAGFPSVWVEGEVSNFKNHQASGHWYFKLKDASATLSAAIFRSANYRVKFAVQDGLRVLVHGKLNVYAPRGEYSLIVDQIQPRGMGALELAFRQLRDRLERLGYFDPGRKKPIPALPRRVAVVTSASGAAVRDVLETLLHRWPGVEIRVRPARCQGDGAAAEIAAAIVELNRVGGKASAAPIDVMIVGRGGGSLEDLWPFNEELVARAIFQLRIPIVTGIGHETDYTIADMVADLRAKTPTDAAVKVVPSRVEMLERLESLKLRGRQARLEQLSRSRERLAGLTQRRCFRAPLDRLRDEERRLDDFQERLQRAVGRRLERWQRQVAASAGRLQTLSPLQVLSRGYSLTRKDDGTVVRDARQVQIGERLETLLQHGRLVSRVEEVLEAKEDDITP